MRLLLLGSPRLIGTGSELLLGPGIPLAILAYLHLGPERASRDHLAALFWPGRPRPLALQSLRQAIHRIRTAIGGDGLVGDARRIALVPGVVSSDVADLVERIRAGDILGAAALRTGRLLDGFDASAGWELGEWLDGERERLDGMFEALLLRQSPLGGAGVPRPRSAEAPVLPREEHPPVARPDEPPSRVRWLWRLPLRAARRMGARRTSVPVRALILLAPLLLGGLGVWARKPPPLAATQAGVDEWSLLYCTSAATDGEFGQLFRMDLDGRMKHRVTTDPGCDAIWIPEAHALVALSDPGFGGGTLHLLRPADNPLSAWVGSPLQSTGHLRSIELPKSDGGVVEGRHILIAAREGEGGRSLYLLDPLADSLRRLTDGWGDDHSPVWDPRRGEVVFAARRSGGSGLFALSLKDRGAVLERLTHSMTLAEDRHPKIWRDGVLFSRLEGGRFEVRHLERATGEERVILGELTQDPVPEGSPVREEVCVRGGEDGRVKLVDGRSGQVRAIVRTRGEVGGLGRGGPCRWTHNGEAVTFQAPGPRGVQQIFVSDRGGAEVHNISRDGYEVRMVGMVPASIPSR